MNSAERIEALHAALGASDALRDLHRKGAAAPYAQSTLALASLIDSWCADYGRRRAASLLPELSAADLDVDSSVLALIRTKSATRS